METPLESLGTNLWVQRVSLTVRGMDLGTRMTVVRLSTGHLWVHSPVDLTEETVDQLARIGPVGYLIAPNPRHHRFLRAWTDEYREAELWGVRRLVRKRGELRWTGWLEPAADPAWAADLDQVLLAGGRLDEAVFFHRLSRTLIVTDLLQSVWPEDGWLARRVARRQYTWEHPTVPRRLRPWRGRARLRDQVAGIGQWNFDRIVLAHGRLVTEDAKETFLAGMAWLDA